MLFPYNTDAPIYHWPLATGGMIVVNLLAFAVALAALAEPNGTKAVEAYALQFGNGLHPTQWLTANFLHVGLFHLLGNLFGLWAFGLIVEGKIGWWRFLAVYLLLGIVALMTVQFLALGLPRDCGLGASAAIYGLMGMALIWAPHNDLQFLVLIGLRPFQLEIPIWVTALIYMLLQAIVVVLSPQRLTSELVHLIGAGFGIAAAIVMLRGGWVDCENWDLFSVMAGRHEMSRDELAALDAKANAPTPQQLDQQRVAALEQIRTVLAQDQVPLALQAHRKMANRFSDWQLPEDVLRRLIAGCIKAQLLSDAILLIRDYLEHHTEYAVPMRLKLAELLIKHEQRPALARRILARIPHEAMTPVHHHYRQQLDRHAQAMIARGVLEVQGEEWE